jgi:hypothetical protein
VATRIAFICRKRGVPYEEDTYLDAFRKHRSSIVTKAQWKTVAAFSKLTSEKLDGITEMTPHAVSWNGDGES